MNSCIFTHNQWFSMSKWCHIYSRPIIGVLLVICVHQRLVSESAKFQGEISKLGNSLLSVVIATLTYVLVPWCRGDFGLGLRWYKGSYIRKFAATTLLLPNIQPSFCRLLHPYISMLFLNKQWINYFNFYIILIS